MVVTKPKGTFKNKPTATAKSVTFLKLLQSIASKYCHRCSYSEKNTTDTNNIGYSKREDNSLEYHYLNGHVGSIGLSFHHFPHGIQFIFLSTIQSNCSSYHGNIIQQFRLEQILLQIAIMLNRHFLNCHFLPPSAL